MSITQLGGGQVRIDVDPTKMRELEQNVRNLSETTSKIQSKLLVQKAERARAMASIEAIENSPTEARTFMQVGRGFVLDDRVALLEKARTTVTSTGGEIPKLQKLVGHVGEKLTKATNEFRQAEVNMYIAMKMSAQKQ
ncbi:MAG: hypothetical protein KVP17_004216 [Porospora cf. gigantea B]|uniref:uncharacterized protein n=1 Tax=Porospora cf. gigantea B TaxID=2853592 RepID=UPI003571A20A|nr:MAG: hypothetical protein KVP17_004216 [Porospora cf. gigantea B]